MSARHNRLASDDRLCTGCGICASIAPSKLAMQRSADGYLRPQRTGDLTAEEHRDIAEVCPGTRIHQTAPKPDKLWGPIVRVRTGFAADPEVRHAASSGGVLTAVLQFLLDRGVIDRVVQTTASTESPLDNATVVSERRSEVLAAAGSRYAPSSPLAGIVAELEKPGRFAFVGKPCDVAALRAYQRRHPEARTKIPYLLSFFCAGIPSRRGTTEILKRLGVDEAEVTSFRYRGDGWPGFATAVTRDGERHRMSYADSWGKVLSPRVQFRCKICPDGSGGFADLVCADAWYGDDSGYPKFDEADGRSLIVTRTERGEELLAEAIAAGYVSAADASVGDIGLMQPYQAKRKRLAASRLAALAAMGRRVPSFRGLNLGRLAVEAGILANAKSFLGLVRRIAQNRLDG